MNSTLRHVLASTVAAGVLAAAGGASAQVSVQGSVSVSAPPPPVVVVQPVPPPPPPPPPVYVQPQPVYVQPQPVYVQPRPVYVVGQPGYVVGPPPYMQDRPRFRFGFDVGVGWLLLGQNVSGPALNFGLRLGAQINNLFAVYYQGNLPLGYAFGTVNNGTGGMVNAAGFVVAETNTVAAEFTLWNILHLGIGPSLDYYAGVVCASSATCAGAVGAFFGANGRIAATFGSVEPGRRRSFSIGADFHPTFTPVGVSFFATVNLGYEFH